MKKPDEDEKDEKLEVNLKAMEASWEWQDEKLNKEPKIKEQMDWFEHFKKEADAAHTKWLALKDKDETSCTIMWIAIGLSLTVVGIPLAIAGVWYRLHVIGQRNAYRKIEEKEIALAMECWNGASKMKEGRIWV